MTLDIRPIAHPDHAVWLPLWQAYQRFYKADIPGDVSAVTWQRMLDPAIPVNAAIAWQGDQPVALVHWIFHYSTWSSGCSCYLQDLYVDERQRGAGIGRQMIEFVNAQAKAAGCAKVHWLTHETNTTAIGLYERVAERPGFIQFRQTL